MGAARARLAALAVVMLAASAIAQPAPDAARGARLRAAPGALLSPAADAVHVVVGRISALRSLDPQGFGAELAVERVLFGNARPGMRLRIAWEELSPSLAVRFANGERVLVALERLPNGSLWTARFPKRDALAVASRGAAFAREPDAASLGALEHYLALSRPQRAASAGIDALANLARHASESLALEAIAQLGALPDLARRLSPSARVSLGAALASEARPAPVRAGVLVVVSARKLAALEPEARALASAGGALAPAAVQALAALGVLSPAELQRYASARDPELRAAVLRGAPRALDANALSALARADASGSVRAAALAALVLREGENAAPAAVDALFDPDEEVQAAALRALPAFPNRSAELLRARAFGARANDTEAIKPALAGLSLLGRDGVAVLREIEASHPNEAIRDLAQFLLGRMPQH